MFRIATTVFALLLLQGVGLGQGDTSNQEETIRTLAQQVKELQEKVQKLEAERSPQPAATGPIQTSSPPPEPAEAAPETAAAQASPPTHDHVMELPGGPQMHIRGFSDVDYVSTTQKGTTNSFYIGALDLFVTSKISERFSMLSEINFEAGDDNNIGIDLERMMLTYTANEHFRLSFGRYHTAIGYYNTAYHHGTWFQTATGRPYLFFFEDQGGILPVHNVGLSLTGTIPSGAMGLNYIAEIGNGRPARAPQNTTVQNRFDENNGKAFNLGLWSRPEQFSGLQFGASFYHDHLLPELTPRIQEYIPAIHVVYITPRFEWLNEGVLIRHTFDGGGRSFDTPGFYTQISHQWRRYRPYFRYQYVNASPLEPVIAYAGLQHGPSLGLRYDWSDFAALKVQYDHGFRRDIPDFDQLDLQIAFTF
ncbi:MAG TPA: hypothetical protein VGU90_08520 [Terriglobales bacterium]|nr:hypothetical protein [Terriglobales bacterium]